MIATQLAGKLVLGVSTNQHVASFVQNSEAIRPLVKRFVAGDTLESALLIVQELNSAGLAVALDVLGENTTTQSDATAATDDAIRSIEAATQQGANAYLSIKLTQLGLDLGEHVVLHNVRSVLQRAAAAGMFVRIDMEGSLYTTRTLEVFSMLRAEFPGVGIVLQAYLYRTAADLKMVAGLGAQVRLVKGAYSEPAHCAFRRKRDTDRNYIRLMEYLFAHTENPAIATHDPRMIESARDLARRHGVAPERFEFQMLYGIRRDLQERLVSEGYRVRVYLPYGAEWYPYLTRRLAERPANMLFIASSLVRERSR